jgi:hypothetical protein
MRTRELIEQCEGLSYRKLDYWCQQGVFDGQHINDRPHRRREFSEEDLRVAQLLARVSTVFARWSGGRGGFVAIYREIAHQVRAGVTPIRVTLVDGIDLHIDIDQPPPPEPPPAEPAEPAEVNFIPGVGVDNA